MRRNSRRSTESSARQFDAVRYRSTWRSVAVSLAVALAAPIAIWAIAFPVRTLALALGVAYAVVVARTARRYRDSVVAATRRAAGRLVSRVTPN